MYSRKSVGPRMDPSGTPALTGYSCERLPSRTTRSHLLLRKEEKIPPTPKIRNYKYSKTKNTNTPPKNTKHEQ